VSKLSIDTIKLNDLVTTIFGNLIQSTFAVIFGLLLGCIYEYRLTLIDFCFVPFIVLANVLRKTMVHGQNRRGFEGNVKAGGILSECVINTKTIFSFNYQNSAVNMYLEAIEYVRQKVYT
jgi:ABC-type bacteriocin/lantibiotic exporter with double-glycine peptidase domain